MKSMLRSMLKWLTAVGVVSVMVLVSTLQTNRDVVIAQTRKPVVITRIYTGPDGLAHAEDMVIKLGGDPLNEISEMFKVTGAEIHRAPAGKVNTWHTAPRRQFLIGLSGRGEIEVAGGKKFFVEPGQMELVEDTTGKGHITTVVGSEDRVTIQLPLADSSRP
jgi:mannose-6-phosphate isomerase-like protein (cupin superfamily)